MINSLAIRSARWDITGLCNLHCLHCYASSSTEQISELSYDEVVAIIKKLMPLGLKEINFSGREPTLRRDLNKIIAWCWENNLIVNITTNGTALASEEFKELLDVHLNRIIFSLDGASAKTHDRIRGTGNFHKTVENIKSCTSYIKENNIATKTGVSCTLQKLNAEELPLLIELCHLLGVDMLAINPVSFSGFALSAKSLLYVPPEEVFACWEKVCKEYKNYKSSYELYLGTFPMEAKFLNAKYELDLPVIQTGCPAGTTIYINPNGESLPCYMLPAIANEIPELKKYLQCWQILAESPGKAVELFNPFISWTKAYSHKNNDCVNCPEFEVCQRCPLIAISDPEIIYRCQIGRKCLDSLKINIDKAALAKIKDYVNWRIKDDNLFLSIHNGDYRSEKEFRLNPFAKSVWNEITEQRVIDRMITNLAKEWSNMQKEEVHKNLSAFLDYFWKEGILTIQQ